MKPIDLPPGFAIIRSAGTPDPQTAAPVTGGAGPPPPESDRSVFVQGVPATPPAAMPDFVHAVRLLLAKTPLETRLSRAVLRIIEPSRRSDHWRASPRPMLPRAPDVGVESAPELLAVRVDAHDLRTAVGRLERVAREHPLQRREHATEILAALEVVAQHEEPFARNALLSLGKIVVEDSGPIHGAKNRHNVRWAQVSALVFAHLAGMPSGSRTDEGETFTCDVALDARLPLIPRVHAINALRTAHIFSRTTLLRFVSEAKLRAAAASDEDDDHVTLVAAAVRRLGTNPELAAEVADPLGRLALRGDRERALCELLVEELREQGDTANETLWALVRDTRIPDAARTGALKAFYRRLSPSARGEAS